MRFEDGASPSDDASAPDDVRRVRVVSPVSRDIEPGECSTTRRAFAERLGLEPGCGAESALDPARLFFVGGLEGTPERACFTTSGVPVDVGAVLETPLRHTWRAESACPEPVAPSGPAPSGDNIARARRYVATIEPAITGQGGHALTFRAAAKLVHGFGLSDPEALDVLLRDYNTRCQPPWTRSELEHKVTSARRDARELGHAVPDREPHREALARGHDEGAPSSPTLNQAVEVRRGDALGELWRPLERRSLYEPPPPRTWLLVRAADGDGRDIEFLPRGKVGMLAAAGGIGKTMVAGQPALLVASGSGRPWLGSLVVHDASRGGRVLVALAEETADEVHRRLYYASCALRLTPEQRERAIGNIVALPVAGRDCGLVRADRNGTAVRTELHAEFLSRLRTDGPWALVVIDPLSRFAGADTERVNASATAFVSGCEELCAAPGAPTVLLLHHTSQASRKAGETDGTAARGVTGLVDAVRWCATLTPERESGNGVVGLRLAKSNYSPPCGEVFLARRSPEFSGALVDLTDEERGELAEAQKPADRVDGLRPCPWVGCRYRSNETEAPREGHWLARVPLRNLDGAGVARGRGRADPKAREPGHDHPRRCRRSPAARARGGQPGAVNGRRR